jgi:hypothetical protein
MCRWWCWISAVEWNEGIRVRVCLCGPETRIAGVCVGRQLCDLCLADILVQSGAAQSVVLQLKGHPTFVRCATRRPRRRLRLVAVFTKGGRTNESELSSPSVYKSVRCAGGGAGCPWFLC